MDIRETIDPLPLEKGFLKVSELHEIYFETYGNPKGIPVVLLHGGPGAGCTLSMTRFFDLSQWYLIMHDQRAAMRSRPFACMEDVSTQTLIQDIEKLKNHLHIAKWMVYGGSWGSLLAIAYGQAHPGSCLGFLLRSIFLGREQDYLHLLYGMGKILPEHYQEFLGFFDEKEKADLLSACYNRIMDPDPAIHLPCVRTFSKWVIRSWIPKPDPKVVEELLHSDTANLSIDRAFLHFSKNDFFLDSEELLAGLKIISHLPAIIVHGVQDWTCLKEQAEILHRHWENSQLWLIEESGHAPIEKAFIEAIQKGAEKLKASRIHLG